MFTLAIILFILAIVFGLIVWLDHVTTLKKAKDMRTDSQEELEVYERAEKLDPEEEARLAKRISDAPDFSKEIVRETIGGMVKANVDSKEIGDTMFNIFNKEIDKRVQGIDHRLERKYKIIIEQKAKNEREAQGRYKKALNDKKKTENIVRSVAEGLVVVDSEGKVVMMNPTAEKLLGASMKDKVGKPITEGLKNSQLLSVIKDLSDSENREIEVISRKSETKKVLRSSTAVVENKDGETVGMVSVLSDVTKQKELEKLKTDFLAKVSHELRTPILTLQNSVSILLNKKLGVINKPQEQLLTIVNRSLKRLSLLVNDILELSRLTSSKMKLSKTPCLITEVVEEVYENMSTWAQSKGIGMERRIEGNIPSIKADADRIVQVLNNLVGNSIKFTPHKGRVSMLVGLYRDNKSVYVRVSDTGVGIAKEDLSKVFDKFHQAGERVSTDISGTGLGLAIAKEIVELHGGKIWAESEEGKGASFTFTLPMQNS